MLFGALAAGLAILDPQPLSSYRRWLLATFATIFLGLRHVTELGSVHDALDRLDFSQPLVLYAGGIVASQLISHVPATVLLLDRTHDPLPPAVAANVGFHRANLIALRLARQPHGLRQLHKVSIPLLLLCAPQVYLTRRGLTP